MDTSKLPYIDLGCDTEDLKKYALEHFGKKIAANAHPETVISRFREIYKEETGITLQDIEDVDEFNEDDEEPVKQEKKKPTPSHVTINIQDDEKDPHPVCGSVQFVAYRIRRNEDVKVPYHIFLSLRDAKKTVLNEKMEAKEVPAYPFSVVEYHFDD